MMEQTYQPNLHESIHTKPDQTRKGIALTELFKDQKVQENYMAGRRILGISDIVDRPIRIVDYRIYEGENNFGKQGEFITIEYYLDGDDENLHETTSQASGIKDRLRAVPVEMIHESGGILTIIEMKKTPRGNSYGFAGF